MPRGTRFLVPPLLAVAMACLGARLLLPLATDVRAAAARARDAAEVFTIGVGTDVDPTLLADVAGASSRFYAVPDADDLAAIYAAVNMRIRCR